MWVDLARLRDIRIRAVEITEAEFRQTAMIIGAGGIRLQFDRLVVVFDRELEVQTVCVRKPASIKGDPEFGAKLDRVIVILDRAVVIVLVGMGIRALSGLVATLSISVLAQSDGDDGGAGLGAVVGLGGLAVGAIYDIATSGSAVDEWNRKHATVMPTALVLRDGYGVGFVGRF